MTERFANGGTDPDGYQRDKEGNLVMKGKGKRSEFENVGADPNFSGKDYSKKEYKAGEYARQSFWGNKSYDRKSFQGDTDGNRFQKASDLGGQSAREATGGKDFSKGYDTGSYATGSARESTQAGIVKRSNDQIENRREVFDDPDIVDWRQDRAMSIERSKSILGR